MTLIEIMVGMVVGLILLSGVTQVFISSKKTYKYNLEVAEIQENGRIIMNMLAREVRMAGYQGCAELGSIPANVIANNPPSVTYNQEAMRGWVVDKTGTAAPSAPAPPASVMAMVAPNTDIMSIQHASDEGMQLTGNMSTANANIQISDNSTFKANDVLFISDCQSVDVFRATSTTNIKTPGGGMDTIAHSTTTNSGNFLSKPYGIDAKVYSFISNAFFVANTGRKNGRGDPIMALYQIDIQGNIQELGHGVENLQVPFGERQSNGSMRYVKANDPTLQVTQVVSVRFAVLMQSTNSALYQDDTNTYNLAGTLIGPSSGSTAIKYANDRRIRRVFVTTVKLRNRR